MSYISYLTGKQGRHEDKVIPKHISKVHSHLTHMLGNRRNIRTRKKCLMKSAMHHREILQPCYDYELVTYTVTWSHILLPGHSYCELVTASVLFLQLL